MLVDLITWRSKGRMRNTKGAVEDGALPELCAHVVNFIVVLRVAKMDLVGGNPYHGPC